VVVFIVSELYPCGLLRVGEKRSFDGVDLLGVPAINNRVDQRGHDHEKEESISFLISAEDKKVYFMGDSDFVPEAKDIKPDILFISVGGTYTAGAREAARTASVIAPKLAIPIHWGSVAGTQDDALLFEELTDVPVKILQPGESVIV